MNMIYTRIYHASDLQLKNVREDIRNTILSGKNIVFPTETVYGVGASALNLSGIENIYKIKGRPSDNPLIMHIADVKDLDLYTKNHQPYVKKLIKAFWPGPLTLVLEKKDQVPKVITGGLESVGIRFPSSHIAQEIIRIASVPIVAPSANISGKPSATLFEHVYEDFNQKVDIIIDGGKTEVGLESTVLDVTKEVPIILRPGMITKAMIEKVVGEVIISTDILQQDIPKAPGMKYKHYAPKAILEIVSGKEKKVIDYINIQINSLENMKVGVIATNDIIGLFDTPYVFPIGKSTNEEEIAANLFAALRKMDSLNVDYIYSISFEDKKFSEAIMNRLLKAADNNITYL
jgi:L-threonylcarbamoyladenylate synthase